MVTDQKVGNLLANRYQLQELIGRGAMGRVFRAQDMLLGGVVVAVKFLSQKVIKKSTCERFEQEATISAVLGEKSIHIVRVRDYGLDDNQVPFYVMEFLQGESLSEMIRRSPIPLHQFINITRQICLGLQCAHQGIPIHGKIYPIIHRDIKPSNIVVVKDRSFGELVKILDFGIAKLLQLETNNKRESFMGTVAYCSPEQMDVQELDNRSDIYSLGVMMFEMLTGQMPLIPPPNANRFNSWYKAHHYLPPRSFESTNPKLVLPPLLKELIMSSLAKSPNDRPQTVDVILDKLEEIQVQYEAHPISKTRSASTAVVPSYGMSASDLPPSDMVTAYETCLRAIWPKSKPVAEIVFPNPIKTEKETLTTLWVMLQQSEIQRHKSSSRHNQFLFVQFPHPMVLWITVIYTPESGPRWLPCFLDLKVRESQAMIKLLGRKCKYPILFFPLEQPERCTAVLTATIDANQGQLLQQWVQIAKNTESTDTSQVSKKHLREELEKLKPKILRKLDVTLTNYPNDLSG